MLVIMLDGNMGMSGFSENALRAFENELKRSVMPFVEQNYRTQTTARSRALAGLSMGGIQTLYAGMKNTELFSYLGVYSSGWFANQPALSNPHYDFIKNK